MTERNATEHHPVVRRAGVAGHRGMPSHQARSNCGPRNCSGSSAENRCAWLPSGQTSRQRELTSSGCRSCHSSDIRPDTPSTITSRASAQLGPTSAIRSGRAGRNGERISERSHSAPARVLPDPRPPRISQLDQSCDACGSPGGNWAVCAQVGQSPSMNQRSLRSSRSRVCFRRRFAAQSNNASRNSLPQFVVIAI